MNEKQHYYINGIGIISPQKTFEHDQFLQEISTYENNVLTCITPSFKSYISPGQLRRLSRMHRIGLTTATICLHDANVQVPDGIITASGYGFLEETEKFLTEMLERNEKQLTPTYFIQGTYNALAGLIALSTKCLGYNNTYVSKGFAFENALHDVMLQLSENSTSNFLVGSSDEAAKVLYAIGMRAQYYKVENISNLKLFDSHTTGTIQGEGSAFFMVSGAPSATTWCAIKDLQMVYTPQHEGEFNLALTSFLEVNKIKLSEIDVWVSGASGNIEHDHLLNHLENTVLRQTPQIRFKHLCGEYCTAVSFGLWIGASILKKQSIPEILKVSTPEFSLEKIETVLIVNQYLNRNYSFLLLKK